MRFKEYLNEAAHRRDISVEFALELLEANCKDAMKHPETPLWRGFKGREDAYLIQPEATYKERRSKNTTNYYTLIMDEFLPEQGYPRRSKSVICTNNEGRDYADGYGNLYALFPYDDVPIGVCSRRDFWETERFSIGNSGLKKGSPEQWNDLYANADLSDVSYSQLYSDLAHAIEYAERNEDARYGFRELLKIFGSVDNIEKVFKEAYSPENLKLNLATTKTMSKFEDTARECWFSGKAVAIQYHLWNQIFIKKTFEP